MTDEKKLKEKLLAAAGESDIDDQVLSKLREDIENHQRRELRMNRLTKRLWAATGSTLLVALLVPFILPFYSNGGLMLLGGVCMALTPLLAIAAFIYTLMNLAVQHIVSNRQLRAGLVALTYEVRELQKSREAGGATS